MIEHPEGFSATRRSLIAVCSAAGIGHTLFPGALLALIAPRSAFAQDPSTPKETAANLARITPEMIAAAAAIAGITVPAEQMQAMLEGLSSQRDDVVSIRGLHLENSTAPAFLFDPVPTGMTLDTAKRPTRISPAPDVSPLVSAIPQATAAQAGSSAAETIAFAPVRDLADLLRTRNLSSIDLTKLYLARLKMYDPRLHFVINLTEDRALAHAAAADKEISSGKYPRPPSRHPLGRKGSSRRERLSHHLGSCRLRAAEL